MRTARFQRARAYKSHSVHTQQSATVNTIHGTDIHADHYTVRSATRLVIQELHAIDLPLVVVHDGAALVHRSCTSRSSSAVMLSASPHALPHLGAQRLAARPPAWYTGHVVSENYPNS